MGRWRSALPRISHEVTSFLYLPQSPLLTFTGQPELKYRCALAHLSILELAVAHPTALYTVFCPNSCPTSTAVEAAVFTE